MQHIIYIYSYQAPGATEVSWAGGTSKRRHKTKKHDAIRAVKEAASRPKKKGDKRDWKSNTVKSGSKFNEGRELSRSETTVSKSSKKMSKSATKVSASDTNQSNDPQSHTEMETDQASQARETR